MKIPIVLACDEKYLAPTYIAIYSALHNRISENDYTFYILVPSNIPKEKKEYLFNLERIFKRVSIDFIDMGERFSNIKMKIEHITSPTYYRLCLPELIKEDKCIYLDSDIVVCKDLTELFEIEIEDNYIAGVLSEGIHLDKVYARNLCKLIGLRNVNSYINAGVLVMNLMEMRRQKIQDEWLKLVPRAFPAQDQDILNLTCYGKIKVLSLKYNTMTKCTAIKNIDGTMDTKVYSKEEIEEAQTEPVIIHYADRVKPWNNKSSLLAGVWWEYYERSDNQNIQILKEFVNKNADIEKGKIKSFKAGISRILQMTGLYIPLKKIKDMYINR